MTTDNEPKIIECEKQRFFGIVGKGPFQECGATFKKLGEIKEKSGDLFKDHKTAMLVLCDVPSTKKEDLVWAAAILIPKDSDIKEAPEGLEEILVPGGRYATTEHRGAHEDLPKSWGQFCMKWIPSQGLCPSKGSRECVHYEVYTKDCSGDANKKEEMVTQLYAPVEDCTKETTDKAKPEIIECEEQRFFGIIGKGPFQECGGTFKKLGEIKEKAGGFTEKNLMAMLVLCDVPSTKPEDFVWAAAMLIPKESNIKDIPEGLEEIIVPGRRCATMLHHGPYEGLPKAWGELCMKWIPTQNLRPGKGSRECVHFEMYLNDCSTGTKKEDLVTKLFAPVEEPAAEEEKKEGESRKRKAPDDAPGKSCCGN